MVVFCRYIVYFSLAYIVKKSYICTKKSGNGSRLGQILEIMLFSKAIQIKLWVNKFNQQRALMDYGRIGFEAHMFSDGKWSVSLRDTDAGIFFSDEMERLITLYAGGGFSMRVFSISGSPVIDLQ